MIKLNLRLWMKLLFICIVVILISLVSSALSASNPLNNKVTSRNHRTLKNTGHRSCSKTCPRPKFCDKKCVGQTKKAALRGRKRGKNASCNHQHRNTDNTKAGTVFRRGQEDNAVPPAPVPTDLPLVSDSDGTEKIAPPQPTQVDSLRDRDDKDSTPKNPRINTKETGVAGIPTPQPPLVHSMDRGNDVCVTDCLCCCMCCNDCCHNCCDDCCSCVECMCECLGSFDPT